MFVRTKSLRRKGFLLLVDKCPYPSCGFISKPVPSISTRVFLNLGGRYLESATLSSETHFAGLHWYAVSTVLLVWCMYVVIPRKCECRMDCVVSMV